MSKDKLQFATFFLPDLVILLVTMCLLPLEVTVYPTPFSPFLSPPVPFFLLCPLLHYTHPGWDEFSTRCTYSSLSLKVKGMTSQAGWVPTGQQFPPLLPSIHPQDQRSFVCGGFSVLPYYIQSRNAPHRPLSFLAIDSGPPSLGCA